MLGLFDFPEATQSAPGPRRHDVDAAADFPDERRVHAEPGRGGGENRGDGDGRSRADRPVVSPDSRARPDGRRDEERAGVSAERARCSATRRSCCRPTRRFSFHEVETDAPGNDRDAGRRPRHRRAGWSCLRACRGATFHAAGLGNYRRAGAARQRRSTSS